MANRTASARRNDDDDEQVFEFLAGRAAETKGERDDVDDRGETRDRTSTEPLTSASLPTYKRLSSVLCRLSSVLCPLSLPGKPVTTGDSEERTRALLGHVSAIERGQDEADVYVILPEVLPRQARVQRLLSRRLGILFGLALSGRGRMDDDGNLLPLPISNSLAARLVGVTADKDGKQYGSSLLGRLVRAGVIDRAGSLPPINGNRDGACFSRAGRRCRLSGRRGRLGASSR